MSRHQSGSKRIRTETAVSAGGSNTRDPGSSSSPYSLAVKNGWNVADQPLTDFAQLIEQTDVALEEMVGGLVSKVRETLALPMLLTYQDESRLLKYRRADALMDERAVENAAWLDVDPRMTLQKALELYGHDLLVFEKTSRNTKLDVLILPVRRRNEQWIRILVRRAVTSSPVTKATGNKGVTTT